MKDQLINWISVEGENFQFILFFGLLFVLIILELSIPFRKLNKNKRRRWSANYFITLLNVVLLSALPVSFISVSVIAERNNWGLLNQFYLPFSLIIILSLVLRGFISFFTHFFMHKIPFLWRLHRVHHLDTEMDVSTTVRFHPAEFVFNVIIGVPLIIFFGFPPWTLLLYELLDVAITLLSHSNITLPEKLERFLHYIIVTPDLHRVHHSSIQKETDSNFGAVFPVWDVIFSTFRTDTTVEQKKMRLGLKEVRDERTNSVLWLLKSPLINLYEEEKKENIGQNAK